MCDPTVSIRGDQESEKIVAIASYYSSLYIASSSIHTFPKHQVEAHVPTSTVFTLIFFLVALALSSFSIFSFFQDASFSSSCFDERFNSTHSSQSSGSSIHTDVRGSQDKIKDTGTTCSCPCILFVSERIGDASIESCYNLKLFIRQWGVCLTVWLFCKADYHEILRYE